MTTRLLSIPRVAEAEPWDGTAGRRQRKALALGTPVVLLGTLPLLLLGAHRELQVCITEASHLLLAALLLGVLAGFGRNGFVRLTAAYALGAAGIAIAHLLVVLGFDGLAPSWAASAPLATFGLLLAVGLAQDPRRAGARGEAFAANGELTAAVAHGLRNPLAGIRAAAQVAHATVTEESAAGALSDVITEVDRLDARVRTLLDFSRPFEPRLEEVDLAELLRVLARGLATTSRARGVELGLDLPRRPVRAHADPELVEEAVEELAANALRALDPCGSLRLSLGVERGKVAILVADTGRGIPSAVQHRVFDPFFSTRPDGTGMGLPIVRMLVERQGGRVALDSSVPGRTVFRLELPLSTGAEGGGAERAGDRGGAAFEASSGAPGS